MHLLSQLKWISEFGVRSLPTRLKSPTVRVKHITFQYFFTRTQMPRLKWSITELWRFERTLEVPNPTQWPIRPFWSELHHSAPMSISWCLWLDCCYTPGQTRYLTLFGVADGTSHCHHNHTVVATACAGDTLFVPTMSSPILAVLSCPAISMRRLLRTESCSSEQQTAGGWEAMVLDWNRGCSAWQ